MKTSLCYWALILPLMMASCKSTQDSGYEDPYVSNFGDDGGYNPYPSGGGGYAAPAPAPSYSAPTYDSPPAEDAYAFDSPAPASSSPVSKPSSSSSTKKSTPAKKTSSSSRSHTVAKGDTLYGLARKYGSTVSQIKSANGLSGDLIRIGQKLKIP